LLPWDIILAWGMIELNLRSLSRWLMLVIPTIWEVEIRRIVVWGQTGQKVQGTHLNQ
jgi:hypothetical protein